jgi:hypothetical protein
LKGLGHEMDLNLVDEPGYIDQPEKLQCD